MSDTETPEHLTGLKKISDDAKLLAEYSFRLDESRCTDAMFALLKLSTKPSSERVEQIADALQQEHRDLIRVTEEYKKLVSEIKSWLGWASIWTDRKHDVKVGVKAAPTST